MCLMLLGSAIQKRTAMRTLDEHAGDSFCARIKEDLTRALCARICKPKCEAAPFFSHEIVMDQKDFCW